MNEEEQDGLSVTSVEGQDGGEPVVDESRQAVSVADRKPEPLHLKTKPIPAIVTLLGGSAVAIDVFIEQFDFKRALVLILAGLVIFLIIGEVVKILLDHIELPNPDAVDADGNVIQKGKSGETPENDEASGESEPGPETSGAEG